VPTQSKTHGRVCITKPTQIRKLGFAWALLQRRRTACNPERIDASTTFKSEQGAFQKHSLISSARERSFRFAVMTRYQAQRSPRLRSNWTSHSLRHFRKAVSTVDVTAAVRSVAVGASVADSPLKNIVNPMLPSVTSPLPQGLSSGVHASASW
jgi:hypothetical protein